MSQAIQAGFKAPWVFLVAGQFGKTYGFFLGEVSAMDPRDAVTRALTMEAVNGKFIGENLGIPMDVVLDVPCNDDTAYELTFGQVLIKVKKTSLSAFDAPTDWKPAYMPYRHGGWYTNVRYPSGASGCVSSNYADGKWRIVCDRRSDDITYPTRDAATRAEYALARLQEAGLYPRAGI